MGRGAETKKAPCPAKTRAGGCGNPVILGLAMLLVHDLYGKLNAPTNRIKNASEYILPKNYIM
jgi:hypothetical protein